MLNSTTASQLPGPPHFVDLHVNPGESVSIQFFDGNETVLRGPTTIKMISQHAYPPMPMPVQVPPGHMIQQIVDENGTLRHIILSALTNGNTNNFSNSTSQFVSHQQLQQQQQSPGGSPYCCCCYNTCSSGNSTQTSMASQVASQHLQPQLSHNQMVFPLNSHSFPRHRRSSRNYSSNTKRSSSSSFSANYYSANPIGKVNSSSRYKSDNPKASYHNRHSANLNYDPISSYDSSNDTKYYLNKSYDYSCNSSNASQASTVDQINDNLKYFKDDSYSIEDEYLIKKSSYNQSDLNTNQELGSCCLDYEDKNDNLTNDDEVPSRKSSLSECINNCNNQQDSLLSASTVNFTDNIDNDSNNFIDNDSDQPINVTQESIKVGNSNQNDMIQVKFIANNDVALESIPVTNINDNTNVDNPKLNSSANIDEPIDDLPINESETRVGENADDSVSSLSEQFIHQDIIVSTDQDEEDKTPTESTSLSDNIKYVGNGNIDSYYTSIEPVHQTCSDDNESDKTDSDDYQDDDNSILSPIYANSHQRSPKNLLPKVEAINLTYNSLSPCSLRLKWFFNQPNDHPEHKPHFIVNMLLSNLEDSPNSRIVHQGHTTTCRVSHLQPQQKYTFRVRTNSEEAVLISNLLTVITPEQQSVAGTKVSGRKSKQQLQQQLLQQQQQIIQQQQLLRQQQHLVEERQTTSSGRNLLSQSGLSSDQRCAILILIGFTFFALIVAVIIQNLLGSGQ